MRCIWRYTPVADALRQNRAPDQPLKFLSGAQGCRTPLTPFGARTKKYSVCNTTSWDMQCKCEFFFGFFFVILDWNRVKGSPYGTRIPQKRQMKHNLSRLGITFPLAHYANHQRGSPLPKHDFPRVWRIMSAPLRLGRKQMHARSQDLFLSDLGTLALEQSTRRSVVLLR